MAHTADIRCPGCGDLIFANECTSADLLAKGLITIVAHCRHCGFQRTYEALSPAQVQDLLQTGIEVMLARYPELLPPQEHPGFPTPLATAPITVTVDQEGWARCPGCGFRFKPSSSVHFNGQVHMRCKQRLTIAPSGVT